MAAGTPIKRDTHAYPIYRYPSIDTEDACARPLATYLSMCVFGLQPDGAEPNGRGFRLAKVYSEWPEPNVQVEYPCASMSGATIKSVEHSLTPTVLDETATFPGEEGSVLWKTGEASVTLQVDFWLNNVPDREQVAAALPALFNPGEGYAGIYLEGQPEYWGLPVRYYLAELEKLDTDRAVWTGERRLRAAFTADIDIVHARCVRRLAPMVDLVVTDA